MELGNPTNKDNAICDLIHTSLVVLLLRAHRFTRHQRLTLPSVNSGAKQRMFSPQLLLPVVNTLQYKLFCERVKIELLAVGQTLTQAGIPNKIRFKGVGEAGIQLVDLLRGEERVRIGGD
ncbi:MAG TPA: hypothetical protein VGO47_15020, partial [Chlamydiales bacterium]|nr:hypothetical protein [Chlamydiales bacterium]